MTHNTNSLSIEPNIDPRDSESILNEIRKLIPFYVPQWKPEEHEEGDVGMALCKTYSQIQEYVINQLNKLPEHNFLEFLNVIGINLSAKHAAKVPVTVTLSNGVTKSILVPKDTKVIGKANSEHDELVFSTDTDMLVTPAKTMRLYSTRPSQNNLDVEIFDHTDYFLGKKPFDFFSGENIQEHIMYIGHDDLFNLENEARITIWPKSHKQKDLNTSTEQEVLKILSDSSIVAWEYNWDSDDESKSGNTAISMNFYRDGNLIILEKPKGTIKPTVVNQRKSKWIRCRLLEINDSNSSKIKSHSQALSSPPISHLELGVQTPNGRQILPDMLYHNDVPLPKNRLFYPFGQNPSYADIFYVSCSEVFSKKGAKISLEIIPKDDTQDQNLLEAYLRLEISWEYWNGYGWTILESQSSKQTSSKQMVEFVCPDDMEPTPVNGQNSYWIRGRITSLSLLPPTKILQRDNEYEINYQFQSLPKIHLELFYSTGNIKNSFVPQHCFTYNNLEYEGCSKKDNNSPKLKPFKTLNDKSSSILLGFDRKISGGPVNLFFSMDEKRHGQKLDSKSALRYYCSNDKNMWSKLDLVDHTDSLTKTGYMQIIFPQNFSKVSVFGDLYWFKIQNTSDNQSHTRQNYKVEGIFLNTVEVAHFIKVTDELLGSSDFSPNQNFKLKNPPVSDTLVELWVNESGYIYDKEKSALVRQNKIFPLDVKNPNDLWIRWEETRDIFASSPSDRHFTLDRARGTIQFGDGNHGKIPPLGKDNLFVDYVTGGGSAGNIKENEIDSLKGSIPFVSTVYNPVAAGGGSDDEEIVAAKRRGPKTIKHRGQAVTADDYEWIIRERFSSVRNVKCLANTDVLGRDVPGYITIAVVASDSSDMPNASAKLLEEIKDYTAGRSLVTLGGQLQIVGPKYASVSVRTEVFAEKIEQTSAVEKKARDILEQFLHPIHGGRKNLGWDFGVMTSISDIYHILEEIPIIDHVAKVSLKIDFLDSDIQPVIITVDDELFAIPLDERVLVCSGKHEIISRWGVS